MKKKMMAALLALTLAAGTMTPLGVSAEEQPGVSAEHVEIQEQGAGVYTGTCGEGAEYTLDENGTLTITGNGSIKSAAFSDFEEETGRVIKKLVVSSGIKEIGSAAFRGCRNLKSVEIPDSVTSMFPTSFEYCSSLESINVDEANTTYESPKGSNAIIEISSKTLLAGCKNTKIPDDVKIIGKSAFAGCSELTAIDIPDSVTKIVAYAFADCSNLTAIHIPAKVTNIGFHVFENCSNLDRITIDENNSNFVVQDNGNAIINQANMALLEGCNNTVIPEEVKSIRQFAFTGREKLKSIHIPAAVTRIGSTDKPGAMVFDGCTGLEEIQVDADNKIFDSRNDCNAIIKSATDTLVTGSNKTVIPEGIEAIGEYAFYDMKALTHITIPQSVIEIGESAFDECENLSTVHLQKGIQTIGSWAFGACPKLTEFVFCGTKADWQAVTIEEEDREVLEPVLKYHALSKTEEVPATCVKDGTAAYWTCSICNKMYPTADMTQDPQEITAPITISATGKHSYTIKKTDAKYLAAAATCEKPAKYYYLCSGCGAFVKDAAHTYENGTAKGHSWNNGVVTEKATTAKEGIKTYTCAVCKATKTEKIAKLKPTTNNSNNNSNNNNSNSNKNNNSNNSNSNKNNNSNNSNSNKNNNSNSNKNNNSNSSNSNSNKNNNNNSNKKNNTVKKGTKVTIKGYKYTVKNSSEVTFTGVKNKKVKKISIPATVKIKNKKYKVTAMSEKSLKGVKAKTVIVGNNVQTIGNSAMENCKQLTSVTLGKNVKKIGKNVFKSDKKLKSITIKSTKLKSVGKNAFKGINSKAKITVPKKKYTSYKKLMKGKGQGKQVKIVKAK